MELGPKNVNWIYLIMLGQRKECFLVHKKALKCKAKVFTMESKLPTSQRDQVHNQEEEFKPFKRKAAGDVSERASKIIRSVFTYNFHDT